MYLQLVLLNSVLINMSLIAEVFIRYAPSFVLEVTTAILFITFAINNNGLMSS